MGLAEESKIPDTATIFLPQRWRQASLATAHLFQEVQEVWLVWTPQEIPVKRMTVLNSILSPHTYGLRVLPCSPFLFFGGMTFKSLHPEDAKQYFSGGGEEWSGRFFQRRLFRNMHGKSVHGKLASFNVAPCKPKGIRIPESKAWNPESKTALDSFTWG